MMTRRLLPAVIAVLTLAALAVPASAVDPTITFTCCQYSTPQVRIAPGGSVTIEPSSGTFADHPLVFVGDPADSKGTADAVPVTRTFATAGIVVLTVSVALQRRTLV